MPIYEFFSPDTNRIYSFFARSLAQGRLTPRCPDNPKARMERMLSRFAVTGNAVDKSVDPVGGPDPRMERVMAEMEGDMASLGDSTPDPRQLGRLMRKMTEATGQKVPEAMQRMIQRLEKGEDPEKLEQDFGDVMESLSDNMGEDAEAKTRVAHALKAPRRDPNLYEMGEYV